ncbi:hypothetical protein F2Q70_00024012 [Brassica cretica]|uniref:Uncharacterized protein n=1 Tax=Brassica cretica TaxID=69181 RepID=A0A8S9GUM1_BRACR|nr:hypothetical protein F2Q70_00024012 [Brassica cretica]KAF3611678.1 hypothetical protein DY000_02051477 [Brassica cretica]
MLTWWVVISSYYRGDPDNWSQSLDVQSLWSLDWPALCVFCFLGDEQNCTEKGLPQTKREYQRWESYESIPLGPYGHLATQNGHSLGKESLDSQKDGESILRMENQSVWFFKF